MAEMIPQLITSSIAHQTDQNVSDIVFGSAINIDKEQVLIHSTRDLSLFDCTIGLVKRIVRHPCPSSFQGTPGGVHYITRDDVYMCVFTTLPNPLCWVVVSILEKDLSTASTFALCQLDNGAYVTTSTYSDLQNEFILGLSDGTVFVWVMRTKAEALAPPTVIGEGPTQSPHTQSRFRLSLRMTSRRVAMRVPVEEGFRISHLSIVSSRHASSSIALSTTTGEMFLVCAIGTHIAVLSHDAGKVLDIHNTDRAWFGIDKPGMIKENEQFESANIPGLSLIVAPQSRCVAYSVRGAAGIYLVQLSTKPKIQLSMVTKLETMNPIVQLKVVTFVGICPGSDIIVSLDTTGNVDVWLINATMACRVSSCSLPSIHRSSDNLHMSATAKTNGSIVVMLASIHGVSKMDLLCTADSISCVTSPSRGATFQLPKEGLMHYQEAAMFLQTLFKDGRVGGSSNMLSESSRVHVSSKYLSANLCLGDVNTTDDRPELVVFDAFGIPVARVALHVGAEALEYLGLRCVLPARLLNSACAVVGWSDGRTEILDLATGMRSRCCAPKDNKSDGVDVCAVVTHAHSDAAQVVLARSSGALDLWCLTQYEGTLLPSFFGSSGRGTVHSIHILKCDLPNVLSMIVCIRENGQVEIHALIHVPLIRGQKNARPFSSHLCGFFRCTIRPGKKVASACLVPGFSNEQLMAIGTSDGTVQVLILPIPESLPVRKVLAVKKPLNVVNNMHKDAVTHLISVRSDDFGQATEEYEASVEGRFYSVLMLSTSMDHSVVLWECQGRRTSAFKLTPIHRFMFNVSPVNAHFSPPANRTAQNEGQQQPFTVVIGFGPYGHFMVPWTLDTMYNALERDAWVQKYSKCNTIAPADMSVKAISLPLEHPSTNNFLTTWPQPSVQHTLSTSTFPVCLRGNIHVEGLPTDLIKLFPPKSKAKFVRLSGFSPVKKQLAIEDAGTTDNLYRLKSGKQSADKEEQQDDKDDANTGELDECFRIAEKSLGFDTSAEPLTEDELETKRLLRAMMLSRGNKVKATTPNSLRPWTEGSVTPGVEGHSYGGEYDLLRASIAEETDMVEALIIGGGGRHNGINRNKNKNVIGYDKSPPSRHQQQQSVNRAEGQRKRKAPTDQNESINEAQKEISDSPSPRPGNTSPLRRMSLGKDGSFKVARISTKQTEVSPRDYDFNKFEIETSEAYTKRRHYVDASHGDGHAVPIGFSDRRHYDKLLLQGKKPLGKNKSKKKGGLSPNGSPISRAMGENEDGSMLPTGGWGENESQASGSSSVRQAPVTRARLTDHKNLLTKLISRGLMVLLPQTSEQPNGTGGAGGLQSIFEEVGEIGELDEIDWSNNDSQELGVGIQSISLAARVIRDDNESSLWEKACMIEQVSQLKSVKTKDGGKANMTTNAAIIAKSQELAKLIGPIRDMNNKFLPKRAWLRALLQITFHVRQVSRNYQESYTKGEISEAHMMMGWGTIHEAFWKDAVLFNKDGSKVGEQNFDDNPLGMQAVRGYNLQTLGTHQQGSMINVNAYFDKKKRMDSNHYLPSGENSQRSLRQSGIHDWSRRSSSTRNSALLTRTVSYMTRAVFEDEVEPDRTLTRSEIEIRGPRIDVDLVSSWYGPNELMTDDRLMKAAESAAVRQRKRDEDSETKRKWLTRQETTLEPTTMNKRELELEVLLAASHTPCWECAKEAKLIRPAPDEYRATDPKDRVNLDAMIAWWLDESSSFARELFHVRETQAALLDDTVMSLVRGKSAECNSSLHNPSLQGFESSTEDISEENGEIGTEAKTKGKPKKETFELLCPSDAHSTNKRVRRTWRKFRDIFFSPKFLNGRIQFLTIRLSEVEKSWNSMAIRWKRYLKQDMYLNTLKYVGTAETDVLHKIMRTKSEEEQKVVHNLMLEQRRKKMDSQRQKHNRMRTIADLEDELGGSENESEEGSDSSEYGDESSEHSDGSNDNGYNSNDEEDESNFENLENERERAQAHALEFSFLIEGFEEAPECVKKENEFTTEWGSNTGWAQMDPQNRLLEAQAAVCDRIIRNLARTFLVDVPRIVNEKGESVFAEYTGIGDNFGVIVDAKLESLDVGNMTVTPPAVEKSRWAIFMLWFAGNVNVREGFCIREMNAAIGDKSMLGHAVKTGAMQNEAMQDGIRMSISDTKEATPEFESWAAAKWMGQYVKYHTNEELLNTMPRKSRRKMSQLLVDSIRKIATVARDSNVVVLERRSEKLILDMNAWQERPDVKMTMQGGEGGRHGQGSGAEADNYLRASGEVDTVLQRRETRRMSKLTERIKSKQTEKLDQILANVVTRKNEFEKIKGVLVQAYILYYKVLTHGDKNAKNATLGIQKRFELNKEESVAKMKKKLTAAAQEEIPQYRQVDAIYTATITHAQSILDEAMTNIRVGFDTAVSKGGSKGMIMAAEKRGKSELVVTEAFQTAEAEAQGAKDERTIQISETSRRKRETILALAKIDVEKLEKEHQIETFAITTDRTKLFNTVRVLVEGISVLSLVLLVKCQEAIAISEFVKKSHPDRNDELALSLMAKWVKDEHQTNLVKQLLQVEEKLSESNHVLKNKGVVNVKLVSKQAQTVVEDWDANEARLMRAKFADATLQVLAALAVEDSAQESESKEVEKVGETMTQSALLYVFLDQNTKHALVMNSGTVGQKVVDKPTGQLVTNNSQDEIVAAQDSNDSVTIPTHNNGSNNSALELYSPSELGAMLISGKLLISSTPEKEIASRLGLKIILDEEEIVETEDMYTEFEGERACASFKHWYMGAGNNARTQFLMNKVNLFKNFQTEMTLRGEEDVVEMACLFDGDDTLEPPPVDESVLFKKWAKQVKLWFTPNQLMEDDLLNIAAEAEARLSHQNDLVQQIEQDMKAMRTRLADQIANESDEDEEIEAVEFMCDDSKVFQFLKKVRRESVEYVTSLGWEHGTGLDNNDEEEDAEYERNLALRKREESEKSECEKELKLMRIEDEVTRRITIEQRRAFLMETAERELNSRVYQERELEKQRRVDNLGLTIEERIEKEKVDMEFEELCARNYMKDCEQLAAQQAVEAAEIQRMMKEDEQSAIVETRHRQAQKRSADRAETRRIAETVSMMHQDDVSGWMSRKWEREREDANVIQSKLDTLAAAAYEHWEPAYAGLEDEPMLFHPWEPWQNEAIHKKYKVDNMDESQLMLSAGAAQLLQEISTEQKEEEVELRYGSTGGRLGGGEGKKSSGLNKKSSKHGSFYSNDQSVLSNVSGMRTPGMAKNVRNDRKTPGVNHYDFNLSDRFQRVLHMQDMHIPVLKRKVIVPQHQYQPQSETRSLHSREKRPLHGPHEQYVDSHEAPEPRPNSGESTTEDRIRSTSTWGTEGQAKDLHNVFSQMEKNNRSNKKKGGSLRLLKPLVTTPPLSVKGGGLEAKEDVFPSPSNIQMRDGQRLSPISKTMDDEVF